MKMERLSERQKFLLGYESQRSFEGPSSSPFEGSDIDFDDVFGGPPRRFSAPGGTRYSSDGVMDTKRCSSFGHLSAEKPVFGEESSTSRRKYQSNDFFDDIFQGVKSCSSPRRVMNPSNSEPFGTSLPAQFSLPTTSTEVKDYPTFGSCSSFKKKGIASSGISSPALSRFSSQAMQEHDDFRSDVWLSDCPSPLSNVISRWNGKSSYVCRYNETNMSGSSNEDSKTTESPIDIDQSHFSMYKWAGGEAPLVMPPREKISSRLGEKDKLERWSSSNGRMSDAEAYHIVEKEVPMKPKTEIGETTQVIAESSSDCTMFSNTSEETKSTSLPEISLSEKTKKEVSMFTKQDCTTDLKTLRSILLDDIEVKVEGKQNAEKTTKKHGGKRISSSRTEVTKADIQDSPKNPGGDLKRSGVRGRVKNFVKIFNHDNYSKPRSNISTQNQSSRWDAEINALVNGATLSAIEMDTEMQFPEMSTKQDTSFVLDENVEQPEDLHSQMKSTIHTSTNTSSHPKEDSPFSDSVPDGSEVTSDKIDGYQENILIQYLSDNQVELSQSSEDQEAIKALDAKILKWSTGKTGNIRSLLSTLQYVLWDDSGWKPVPLVNIIEGNAVKRAYQKALLCLHPDKLQQKGAAFHQKYIAEKVFDILQEAWDHFNSLGSI